MANKSEPRPADTTSDAELGSDSFDANAYVAMMTAQATARTVERRRPRQQAYRALVAATLLALSWTPAVIAAAYAVDWNWLETDVAPGGWSRVAEWRWLLGTFVIASYSFFYGLAVAFVTQNNPNVYASTIAAFYGLWVWLPLLLIYPGSSRLGIDSDVAAVWVFVLIGAGATAYAGFVGSWAKRHFDLVRSWTA